MPKNWEKVPLLTKLSGFFPSFSSSMIDQFRDSVHIYANFGRTDARNIVKRMHLNFLKE